MSLLGMITRLVEADVEFVVIGGLAARAHGSVRITEDLDICYSPTAENVGRLAGALRDWNPYLRNVDPGLPWTMHARAFRDTPVMTLITDHGAIDLMDRVDGVGDYAKVYAASIPVASDRVAFRALDLPGLLKAKRATGRPKDREQIPELEALMQLRRRRAR